MGWCPLVYQEEPSRSRPIRSPRRDRSPFASYLGVTSTPWPLCFILPRRRGQTGAPVDRRTFLGTLTGSLLAAPLAAEAQPAGKVYRIGLIVTATRDETGHLIKALSEGLRELGYVEGRNVVLELRFAEGRQERLPALAAELVQLRVDVLVTGSNPVIAAVKQVSATIPVVMAVSRDPVGAKFIASLARPGGNITGLANDTAPEIIGKNLALLKEAVPRVSRVAFLWNPVPPGAEASKNAAGSAARNLGVAFQPVAVRSRSELEGAFAVMVRERANAVVVAQDPVTFGSRSQVVLLAARSRLPAVYGVREFAEAGGLMSYGPNIADQFRRAATYVDKILKGAKPGDLPIEQPTKFELVINLKAAKALGLTIPQSVLQRADQVIDS
jgi:putative tryptophan/tyrosine transport system substrate-binding protein